MKAEVIARRSTADGKHVLLWSDGSLTWALGHAIKGSAFPRTREQSERALRAGWLLLGDVELYDSNEIPTLVKAARWAADRDGLPGTMRARFAALTTPKGPKPVWTVLQTDRDGKPTLRVWRLPRLIWPGLAVWHERGKYEIMYDARRDGTYEPTGFSSPTLAGIMALLPTVRVHEDVR